MEFQPTQIWAAAGVLLGFQVSSFAWRIQQESEVADKGDISWLPPADYLNLLGMIILVLGIFVLPVIGIVNFEMVKMLFGLSAILFVGHSFALAGHYELFNHQSKRSYNYFPLQEKIIIIFIFIMILIYIILWFKIKDTC